MSRALWFAAGAAAGTYAALRARRAAESLTPDGLRDRAAGLGLGARLFAEEVRLGAAEKEVELRARLRAVPDGPRELGDVGTPVTGLRTSPTIETSRTGTTDTTDQEEQ